METVLPIAEIFDSVQGEGQWAGTRMVFIRLAGCNVGKSARALKIDTPFPLLPTGREAVACTSWDGRSFPCDTDYNLTEKQTPAQLAELVRSTGAQHICFTGGEPLLHWPLLENVTAELGEEWCERPRIHIETSGTLVPRPYGQFRKLILPGYWVTVSPKINCQDTMVKRADELKLLVDEHLNADNLTPAMREHNNVFISPINGVNEIDHRNVDRCRELQKTFPHWRISVQQHKIFGWR